MQVAQNVPTTILRNIQKKIKLVIKRSEQKKKQNVGIFESHRKIDQLENSIEKKIKSEKFQKRFQIFLKKFFKFSNFGSKNCAENTKNCRNFSSLRFYL